MRVRASSPQGRFSRSAERLDGTRLHDAWAWGKHLFLDFEGAGDHIVHIHLGLYGSWRFSGDESFTLPTHIGAPRVRGEHDALVEMDASSGEWSPPPARPSVRLRLDFGNGVADLSGPARCDLVGEAEVAAALAKLGPDPLRADCDPEAFYDRVRGSRRRIGELVMDQSVVAGPGNIYRAECLFRVGISPLRRGSAVARHRLQALYADLATTMADGVRRGQIVTVDPADVPDPLTDAEAARFYVYHRAGRACLRCGATVIGEDMAGRRLFRCPGCQR